MVENWEGMGNWEEGIEFGGKVGVCVEVEGFTWWLVGC